MRLVVAAVLGVCSSCAWLFQDHLPSEYRGKSEPMCSTSNGWATVDGVFAALNVAGAIAVAAEGQTANGTVENGTTIIVGGVVWALVHVFSAGTGVGWATDCRNARAKFDDRERGRALEEAEQAKREARAYEARKSEAAATGPAELRGFYCFASPTNPSVGACVRDKAECERARDAAIGALPDLSACGLVESAWCVAELCFPSTDGCEARRARASADVPCDQRM